jgi:hypothetical protein
LRTPPAAAPPPRDELVIKVHVAMRMPGVDVGGILQVHRRRLVEEMQRYTHLKAEAAVAAAGGGAFQQDGPGGVREGQALGGGQDLDLAGLVAAAVACWVAAATGVVCQGRASIAVNRPGWLPLTGNG